MIVGPRGRVLVLAVSDLVHMCSRFFGVSQTSPDYTICMSQALSSA